MHNIESEVLKLNSDRHAINELISIPQISGDIFKEKTFEANYSDIDINQHLTATRYIDWVFDTFKLDGLSDKNPKSFKANYIKELIYGQKAVMEVKLIEKGTYLFQLLSTDKAVNYFQAELKF